MANDDSLILADSQKQYLEKCQMIADHLRAQSMKAQNEFALFTIAEFLREAAFVVETGIHQEQRKYSPEGTLINQKGKVTIDKGDKGRTDAPTSSTLFPKDPKTSKKD